MKEMKQSWLIFFALLLNFEVFAIEESEKDFSEEDIEYFLSTVKKFEDTCLDKDGSLKQKVYIEGNVNSCKLDAEFIRKEYISLSEYLDSNPEAYQHYLYCQNNKKPEKSLNDLAISALEVSQKMTCSEKEKMEKVESCFESFECNNLRSIQAMKPAMPFLFRKGVDHFIDKRVENKGYDSSCLDSSRSDCFTELWTSFTSNIIATGKSLWDLIKKSGETLWNIPGYFSKKSEDMHTAMVQKEEDVVKFLDDPIGWISSFMNKVKYSIQSWMKTSVFCQKWEDTPHMSKCVEPLESFDCMDCGTVTNATCATMGVMASELGMAALTAGIGNIAAAGVKITPKALKVVSNKALKKVSKVAPELSAAAKKAKKSSKIKGTKSVKDKVKASKVAQATAAAIKAAKAAKAVGSEKVKRVLASIEKVQTKVVENKVVKTIMDVQDKVNITGKLADKAAEKGMKLSDKLLHHTAEKANINTARVTTNIRRTTRIVRARKGFDKASAATGGNHTTIASNHHGHTTSHTTSHDSPAQGHVRSEAQHREPASHTENKQNHKHEEVAQKERPTQERKQSPNEKKNEQIAKKEQDKKSHKKEEHEENEAKKTKLAEKVINKDDIIKGLAANNAGKILSEATNSRKRQQRESSRRGNSSKTEKSFSRLDQSQRSVAAATQAIGARPGVSKSQVIAQGEAKRKLYSKENKSGFINSMIKNNPSMSKRKAARMFDERKRELTEALEYLKKSDKKKSNSDFTDKFASFSSNKNKDKNKLDEDYKYEEATKAMNEANERVSRSNIVANPLDTSFVAPRRDGSVVSNGASQFVAAATGSASAAISSGSESFSESSNDASENEFLESYENQSSGESDKIENTEIAQSEDALENSDEIDEEVESLEEMQKERKIGSRKLASILEMLDENIEVEENAPFSFSVSQLSASSIEAQKTLTELENYLDSNPASLGRKTVIKTKEYQIHTYEFETGVEYTLKVKDGKAEVLDKNRAKTLKTEAKKAKEVPLTTMTSDKP